MSFFCLVMRSCSLLKKWHQMFVETAVQRSLFWGAIYVWVTGMSLAADISLTCPQLCQCNSAVLEVNCSSRHLSTVPTSVSGYANYFYLTHNKIKTLGHRQFSGLTQLWDLDLSDNILSMIEVEAFVGLRNLLILRLARNQLKIIPAGVFTGLRNLRLLDISENEILVLLDFTFRDLLALQHIEARKNDLVFISNRAFKGLTSLQELNLDHCNLTSVPTEALSQLGGLTTLRFLHLGLTTLPNNSLRRLGRLRELVVSHCPWLDTLADNSLIGLNLTALTISNCNLSTVPYAPLHHLVYLVYLDLSFNPITHIERNRLGDLLRLQELHLVGGGLLHVEPGAFHGLARFHLLNISRNSLVTLEEGVFGSLRNLETLRLDENPLACDCRLSWVVRRRPRLAFNGRPPVCATPVQAQGRSVQDFSEAELPGLFTCRPPRILRRKPQEIRIDEGHTVLLNCLVDGDPVPTTHWINPRLKVLSGIGRIRILASGSLEVRYAQVQDSGRYVCEASNAGGNDSFTVSLHVRGFPSSTRSHMSQLDLDDWPLPSASPGANNTSQSSQPFPFDMKTLVIAMTMGFISFLSSVALCFICMFFWSQGKGQIKHTASIDFVPRSTIGNSPAGGGNYMDSGKFTVKLI